MAEVISGAVARVEAMLNYGVPCEAIVGGKPCGIRAIMTVDADGAGMGDHYPVCSESHAQVVIFRIQQNTALRPTVIGINGHGRG